MLEDGSHLAGSQIIPTKDKTPYLVTPSFICRNCLLDERLVVVSHANVYTYNWSNFHNSRSSQQLGLKAGVSLSANWGDIFLCKSLHLMKTTGSGASFQSLLQRGAPTPPASIPSAHSPNGPACSAEWQPQGH